jgi:L-malate glycosyltransferase
MPIRVSFLIDRLSRAGTESQLLALIRVLDRSQVVPSLILLDGTDTESRSLEPDNCEVIRLGVKRLLSREAWSAARKLRSHWLAHRPDILQVYFLDSAYFGIPLANVVGIPKLVRVRNNLGYWLTPKHRFLNRLLSLFCDATLTNSEAGRQALQHSEYLPKSRIQVLPNGVDLERFNALRPAFSAETVVVGCVANLRPVKNIDGLLRAASLVTQKQPKVRFRIAGDGEERAKLLQLRDSLALGNSVEFVGSVADVPAFLGSVDVAVLPSHSEGMSNAVLEYMAAGRAIVATDVGANRQLLAGCGSIVPPGSGTVLADAILELVTQKSLAQQYANTAQSRVEEQFSRAAMARRFEAYYRGLLQGMPTQ